MISELKRWGEAADVIGSQGFRVMEEEAEREIRELIRELRDTLDPRIAGKIDGIEWVFTTLCKRLVLFAENEEATESPHQAGDG